MKKALMILLFCAMLTGCGNSDKEAMTVTTAVSHETVTTTTAASVSETTELTTTEISAETTDATAGKTSTSKTTKRSVTAARETGTTTRSVTESTVSSQTDPERISETEMPKTTDESRQTTAAKPAVTTTARSATTTSTTTTTSKPKQSVSEKPKETAATTTTTAATTTAVPSGIKWSDSMKVWRKLCEGKKLTGSEQDIIRSEILDYAVSSFNGKKDIHVSFGIDSYDISYEKPLNLKANKKMTSMSNAHMDAYADPNCKGLIDYAKSEKEIYDIVSDTRQCCLHVIDYGLFNRWEIFTINNDLKYASDIDFGIGFDEDMAIWFLTQD